jgi:hypothetical protein
MICESSVQIAVFAVIRRLVAGFSLQRTGFSPVAVIAGFVLNRAGMEYIHGQVLTFPPINDYSTDIPYSLVCNPGDWQ